jgi:hypothetical protein
VVILRVVAVRQAIVAPEVVFWPSPDWFRAEPFIYLCSICVRELARQQDVAGPAQKFYSAASNPVTMKNGLFQKFMSRIQGFMHKKGRQLDV